MHTERNRFPYPHSPSIWKGFCLSFKIKSCCYLGCLQTLTPCYIYVLSYLLPSKCSWDTATFSNNRQNKGKFLEESCHPILLAAQNQDTHKYPWCLFIPNVMSPWLVINHTDQIPPPPPPTSNREKMSVPIEWQYLGMTQWSHSEWEKLISETCSQAGSRILSSDWVEPLWLFQIKKAWEMSTYLSTNVSSPPVLSPWNYRSVSLELSHTNPTQSLTTVELRAGAPQQVANPEGRQFSCYSLCLEVCISDFKNKKSRSE